MRDPVIWDVSEALVRSKTNAVATTRGRPCSSPKRTGKRWEPDARSVPAAATGLDAASAWPAPSRAERAGRRPMTRPTAHLAWAATRGPRCRPSPTSKRHKQQPCRRRLLGRRLAAGQVVFQDDPASAQGPLVSVRDDKYYLLIPERQQRPTYQPAPASRLPWPAQITAPSSRVVTTARRFVLAHAPSHTPTLPFLRFPPLHRAGHACFTVRPPFSDVQSLQAIKH